MLSTEGKVINCRAAVLWKDGTPLTIENITVDPPKTGEVRVRMVASGLCVTDGHYVWGMSTDLDTILDRGGNPMVLGHEGAGIVESIGPDVTNVKPGDKVIALWMPQCEKCQLCANPKTNHCMSDNVSTTLYHKNKETRLKINGNPLLLFAGIGTYSEYSVLRETMVTKVDPNANLKTVVICGCAVGTGVGSASNIAKVHPGASCAIWGLGAIGLSAILGCKMSGATTIIGVDINSDKEKIARQFGATHFINPKELGVPIEQHLQKDGGIEYTFDCIGSKEVLDQAYKSLTPWGSITFMVLGEPGNKVEANVTELLNGRSVLGGYFGNQKPRQSVQRMVEQHLNGSLPIDGLITHRIKLEDINEGFDRLKAGNTISTIIEF